MPQDPLIVQAEARAEAPTAHLTTPPGVDGRPSLLWEAEQAAGRRALSGKPVLFPASIFREDATKAALATSAEVSANHYAEKLANQLFYARASESGNFYGYSGMGYGGWGDGYQFIVNFLESTEAIYAVGADRPGVKVWLVNESGGKPEEVQDPTNHNNLQSRFLSVPMPDPALVPFDKHVWPEGTDKWVIAWDPDTDELWEMWRCSQFAAGAHKGEWKFGYGVYIPNVSAHNGVLVPNWGAASASGTVGASTALLHTDVLRVLRGGKIGHALGIGVQVEAAAILAPAVSNDGERKLTRQTLADNTTPNPAYTAGAGDGSFDEVPIGLWCRFPPTSRAADHGITGRLEVAIHDAIREHGLFVRDGSGNCSMHLQDPRTIASPYGTVSLNPFAGAVVLHGGNTATQLDARVNADAPARMTDPSLVPFDEELHGTTSVFSKMPWRTLEQLAPRTP
jgi:hypothetical protein